MSENQSQTRRSDTDRKEIALAIPYGVPHLGRVVHGIREFAKQRPDWRFLVSPETHHLPPTSLKGWIGDGVIALCNTPEDEKVLRSLPCPIINISGALKKSAFPRVRNDYYQLGRSGAAYLRTRGFRRFGYYGVETLWYSSEIERGYSDYLKEHAVSVRSIRDTNTIGEFANWKEGQDALDQWLLSFEPPFAIMSAHDPRGAMVVRACERTGLKVPSDVAVLGVNDDTATCETCRPELSSIDRNGFAVGLEAARCLDLLMRGEPVPTESVISHGKVRERESTQTFALEQAGLAAAVTFVEEHFQNQITVEQIAEVSGKSRRWLEDAFRKTLNCSPSEFVERARVQFVINTLEKHRLKSIGKIASQAGFSGSRQLHAAFLRQTGNNLKTFQAKS